jgi:hypothetical protein
MQPQALPTLFSCGSQMEHFIMQHEVCTGPALPLGRLRRGWNGGKPPACPLAQTSNVPLSGQARNLRGAQASQARKVPQRSTKPKGR